MRDIKIQQNLAGDDNWPFMPFVKVKAISPAEKMPESATQIEGEMTVQTWQYVAVMEVSSDSEVYFGFKVGNHAQFMNVPVETHEGKFGARVGDGDVSFFVIPRDLTSRPTLQLVEVVSIDDERYTDLPLY